MGSGPLGAAAFNFGTRGKHVESLVTECFVNRNGATTSGTEETGLCRPAGEQRGTDVVIL